MLDYLKDIFAFEANSPLMFTQFYFWAFFAIVYALFSLVGNKCLMRNSFLFFVSLFFYYKASGLFVGLLGFVIVTSYGLTLWMERLKHLTWKRVVLTVSVGIDLMLLAYMKYAYFFADVFGSVTGVDVEVWNVFAAAGNSVMGDGHFTVDKIVLPVGISFFTFQVISYTVDVYRGRIEAVRNVLDYGFYVSFFPQLVAGPIVRATEFIPQMYRKFHLGRRHFGLAVFWILNGLAKKLVLSDYLAVNFVDRVFEHPTLFTGFENLAALLGYSLQVYADFSGYTDIAIGVAMLMGFHLPKNFNSPYKATNAGDFWRRWHISLSSWLRDYLYIPLGGNRNASFGTYFWLGFIALIVLILSGSWWATGAVVLVALILTLVAWGYEGQRMKIITDLNAFVTMLIGGLWHGASWNFMLWGGLNGLGIIVYKQWARMRWVWRMVVVSAVTGGVVALSMTTEYAIWNILSVWMLAILLASGVRYGYLRLCNGRGFGWLGSAWGVLQTFMFVSFTRLFFRAGSNLDPAEANETAWRTATSMIAQIGGRWQWELIPAIAREYWVVFVIIAVGMMIHWLPTQFKRWYRLNFAMLPVPVMAAVVVLVVFVVYQFVSADLQSFIYFQF